jgi:hypothetical protein
LVNLITKAVYGFFGVDKNLRCTYCYIYRQILHENNGGTIWELSGSEPEPKEKSKKHSKNMALPWDF